MSRPKPSLGALGNEAVITLGLLNAIHENSSVTQRSAAGELGIALGLVNTYLKRCVKKGWVKVAQAPANRYLYYLTPHGFAEKSQLTRQYLSISFNFFRDARCQCSELFALSAGNGWNRMALHGVSDLAEIATLCAREHSISLIAVIDPISTAGKVGDIPIVRDFSSARNAVGGIDAVIITDLNNPQDGFEALARHLPVERILTPSILNISRTPPILME